MTNYHAITDWTGKTWQLLRRREKWTCDGGSNTAGIIPEYSWNYTRITPNYCLNHTRVHSELYQNIAGSIVLIEYRRNYKRIQYEWNQIMAGIRAVLISEYSQNYSRVQQKFYQNTAWIIAETAGTIPDYSRNCTRIRPEYQNTAGIILEYSLDTRIQQGLY